MLEMTHVPIEGIEDAPHEIPTDEPESDGTLAWDWLNSALAAGPGSAIPMDLSAIGRFRCRLPIGIAIGTARRRRH